MTATTLSTHDAEADPDHATPHRRDKQNRLQVMPWRNLDNAGPCGSVNSCALDMVKWLRFQLSEGLHPATNEPLILKTALKETHTPQMVIPEEEDFTLHYPDTVQRSYGMGWTILDYRGGHKLVRHGGAIGGFRSHVCLLPRDGIGVAVMLNAQTWLAEPLANSLVDCLLALPLKDWVTDFDAHHKRRPRKQRRKNAKSRQGGTVVHGHR
jgi:CubicO group peptidase (beta-lactamase class C family)